MQARALAVQGLHGRPGVELARRRAGAGGARAGDAARRGRRGLRGGRTARSEGRRQGRRDRRGARRGGRARADGGRRAPRDRPAPHLGSVRDRVAVHPRRRRPRRPRRSQDRDGRARRRRARARCISTRPSPAEPPNAQGWTARTPKTVDRQDAKDARDWRSPVCAASSLPLHLSDPWRPSGVLAVPFSARISPRFQSARWRWRRSRRGSRGAGPRPGR